MQRITGILERDFGLSGQLASEAVLRIAVRDRMHVLKIDSLETYVGCLAGNREELQSLVEHVVVPETWFFRNPESLAALTQIIANEWRPAHPGEVLRILSVPCSTGEESYSIAIALAELGLRRDDVRIDAMDISRRALAKAERAVYGRNSFRGLEAHLRTKYWSATAEGAAVDAQIRKWVTFTHGNLADAGFTTPLASYDVIFCRNLLIYFDGALQEQVILRLQSLLPPGGLLFVGPAEALLAMEHGFASAGYPMAFAFRKAVPERRLVVPPVERAMASLPPSARQQRRPLAALAVRPTVTVPLPISSLPAQDALESARGLADAGRLADAIAICERYVREHGTSAPGWYLLGLVHDALGEAPRAIECYRKTMFLDPSHADAAAHLRMVRRQGVGSARPQRR